MKPTFKDEKELALIQRVALVFIEKGMKAMTMDDIAVELHVSKKTLYKYVKNRAELVKKCVQLRVHKEIENRTMIQSAGLNAVEETLKMTEFSAQVIANSHEKMHSDLEQYFPEAFKLITEFKANFLYESVLKNIQRGINEGLYLSSISPEIIAKMYIAKIDLVFDGDTFPATKFKFKDVLNQVAQHQIRGMATKKGLETLEQLINN